MTRLASLVLAVLLAGCASQDRAPRKGFPFAEPAGALLDEVRQSTIDVTICVPGWTATVRPSTSFVQGVKRIMLLRAGVDFRKAPEYELDHFVPLALGGSPRSEDNLWLQSWEGAWNARLKDRLERRLRTLVCAHRMPLDDARTAIRTDWKSAYAKYVGGQAAPREEESTDEEGLHQ